MNVTAVIIIWAFTHSTIQRSFDKLKQDWRASFRTTQTLILQVFVEPSTVIIKRVQGWSSRMHLTDLTSPGSSVTNTSVLQLAIGLMDSSTGGTTKLLLTGSHNPWPRL